MGREQVASARTSPPARSELALALAVALAVFLTRLPFLLPGYGLDADGWRIAHAGWHLANRGEYIVSREPGFPVLELSAALLWRGGPAVLNGTTALMSAAAAALVALIVRRLLLARPAICVLAALAFAFTPVVFSESTTSMDYSWACALLLASVYAVLRKKPLAGGLLLGLAIGCRFTTVVHLLPIAVLAALRTRPSARLRTLAVYGTASLLCAGALYTLVLAQARWSFDIGAFARYEIARVQRYHQPPLATALGRATLGVWGGLGCVALALGAVLGCVPALRRARSQALLFAALAVVIGSAPYAGLAHEAGYLIPVVPFVLVLFAALLKARAFGVVGSLVILAGWVRADSDGFSRGRIFREHEQRAEEVHFVERCVTRIRALEAPSKVVAGPWFMKIEAAAHGTLIGHARVLVDVRSAEQAGAYRERGFLLYYVPGAERENRINTGIDVAEHGFEPLFEPQ